MITKLSGKSIQKLQIVGHLFGSPFTSRMFTMKTDRATESQYTIRSPRRLSPSEAENIKRTNQLVIKKSQSPNHTSLKKKNKQDKESSQEKEKPTIISLIRDVMDIDEAYSNCFRSTKSVQFKRHQGNQLFFQMVQRNNAIRETIYNNIKTNPTHLKKIQGQRNELQLIKSLQSHRKSSSSQQPYFLRQDCNGVHKIEKIEKQEFVDLQKQRKLTGRKTFLTKLQTLLLKQQEEMDIC